MDLYGLHFHLTRHGRERFKERVSCSNDISPEDIIKCSILGINGFTFVWKLNINFNLDVLIGATLITVIPSPGISGLRFYKCGVHDINFIASHYRSDFVWR